ncbi:MAG: ribosome recycling factor [Patescibacteria group bacterium]|nr:ribosome recycling factor [Patescibacteria group bacterium]
MNIQDKKEFFEKILEHTKIEIGGLRTSNVTPSLVENIKVDVYGSKMPLIQLGSISVPEPRQLLVETWDKNILKDVEKALETASLGLSIKNEGNFLRLTMPPMTEDTRKQVIKLLNEKIEKSRISLRALRDEIRNEIQTAEKNKDIDEDSKFRLQEDLDKTTREYTAKVEEMGEKKEKEILQ